MVRLFLLFCGLAFLAVMMMPAIDWIGSAQKNIAVTVSSRAAHQPIAGAQVAWLSNENEDVPINKQGKNDIPEDDMYSMYRTAPRALAKTDASGKCVVSGQFGAGSGPPSWRFWSRGVFVAGGYLDVQASGFKTIRVPLRSLLKRVCHPVEKKSPLVITIYLEKALPAATETDGDQRLPANKPFAGNQED